MTIYNKRVFILLEEETKNIYDSDNVRNNNIEI